IKTHCPEFFKNRDPIKYQHQLLETILVTPLEIPTHAGYQILLVKFINLDPNKFIINDIIKSVDMAATLMLHQKGTAPGHLILADLEGVTFGHLAKLWPTSLMKFFFYLQEALPFRLKGIMFINIPSFMDKLMAILKPFVKKELLDSFQLYSDKWDGLYATIPQECFPVDHGGQNGSINELLEQRKKNFFAKQSFFLEDEKLTSDETRRTGKSQSGGNIFGMEGS
ncbi:CRAL-TRIO domain containing protein, partial [Oryctes borbonicus]